MGFAARYQGAMTHPHFLGPHGKPPFGPPISAAHQTTLGRREAIGQQTQIRHLSGRGPKASQGPNVGSFKAGRSMAMAMGFHLISAKIWWQNAAKSWWEDQFSRVSHGILFLHICGAFMQSVYQFQMAIPRIIPLKKKYGGPAFSNQTIRLLNLVDHDWVSTSLPDF